MLRTVHLHGLLGEEFGHEHRFDIDSPVEALRALACQNRGFEARITEGAYTVTVGLDAAPENCAVLDDPDQLNLRLGNQTDIHIAPGGTVAGIETVIIISLIAITALISVAMILMMKAPKPQDREEATKISSFMFDGAQNVLEQGHPVPLVYGEMRVGSIVASSGIITADLAAATPPGGKSDGSGFVGSAGSTGDSSGQAGTVGITDGFTGSETPIGGTIDRGVVLYGGGGKGGAQDPPTEQPNSLQSAATARVLEIVSEGEIVGLVDGMKSVFLDDTAIQNPDGTFNFQGVHVEQRVGLPDQDYIQGFAQAENTTNVNTQLKVLVGPITRSILNPDATMARVTIRVPALMKTDTSSGDITGTSVQVKISVQADGGGFQDVYTMTINGKTNSGYERSVQIVLPPGDVRDVRLTRLTADSVVTSLQNDTYWSLLTEVIEAKLSYPDTALVALTVDARQFGTNIAARSYLIRGLIIEVPSNYDPVARTYAGVWDGTFKRAWSNSPPWVLRDIIISRRYGLGTRVPASALDKWALYAIAQYCDGLVPDGHGGTQPRFTLNCCINNAMRAYDLLASVAGMFRGFVHWSSGAIVATQDRPEDPSILLTPTNVVDGKFSYGRATAHDRRRSVAVLWWNDPTDAYKLAPAIYEDPDLIRQFGRRPGSDVTAFGCTNEGQAMRAARWLIEDERPTSNAVVKYAVGDDHAFIEPGRIAMIADPMFAGVRRGGRVKSATADQVVIDRPFTVVVGRVYNLRVMLPDGSVATRTITNAPGETATINLDLPSFAILPNPGAVWTIESDTVANRQWRVRAIATDDPPYEVHAQLHNPTKYARVEEFQDLQPPDYSELPSGPLVPPTDLGVTEFLLGDGTAAIPCALFGWTPGVDPRVKLFQAGYRPAGGEFIDLGDSTDNSRTVRNIAPGDYEFRVRAMDALGRVTAWQTGTATMDGQADGMPEVEAPGVVVNEDLFSVKLEWFEPADVRPLRYEILFEPTGVFLDAVSLGLTDRTEYTINQPGSYWVRTRFLTFYSPAPEEIEVSGLIFSAGIVPHLTNDTFLVPAFATGEVISYAGATGSMVVMSGSTDISTNFALSTPGGGNPQTLTVNYVGRTYTVTAGFDDGEDTATLVIRATGSGAYAGVVLDKVFTLGKAKQGMAGIYRDIKFQRSNSTPATPVVDDPAGWYDGVPAGNDTLWMIVAFKTSAGVLIGDWSDPQPISGVTPRGAYSPTATYYLNNIVTFNGGTYIAVQDNFTAQPPTGTGQANDFWDVYAAPGDPGEPATPPSGFSATIDLTSGSAINLRSIADANGYTGLSDATITFRVPNGVTIRGAAGAAGAAGGIGIDSGSWPSGTYAIALTLVIQNGGIVDGGGGGGSSSSLSVGPGGTAGDAIYLREAFSGGVTVDVGGIVRGGGGGGSAGARHKYREDFAGEITFETWGGGGGGGGFPNGLGGAYSTGNNGNGTAGAAGTVAGGGAHGNGTDGNDGGNGGNAATAGGAAAAAGGAAGYAVRKNGHTAVVTNNGTLTGTAA